MTISEALSASVSALDLKPQDKAAVELARRYAALLDAPDGDVGRFGPLLLSTLTALGMTPAGRAAVAKGKEGRTDDGGGSKADELRARRAARQHASTA
ncbi:hypothetical protein ACFYOT_26415 [Saccharothrix saharensis]|uniref:terminase small subunit n=1 Tax=Saccharothrix saharensis TaxID=571190 RepID=UPI00369AB69E